MLGHVRWYSIPWSARFDYIMSSDMHISLIVKLIGQWNLNFPFSTRIFAGKRREKKGSQNCISRHIDAAGDSCQTAWQRIYLLFISSGISYFIWREQRRRREKKVIYFLRWIFPFWRKKQFTQKRQLVNVISSHQPIKRRRSKEMEKQITNEPKEKKQKTRRRKKTKIDYDTKVEPRRNALT